MTRGQVNEIVAGAAAVLGLVVFGALILRPAWTAYSRLWERVAAVVLSFYVLAVLVGVGVVAALAAIYHWN
jgi:hypothetical protein